MVDYFTASRSSDCRGSAQIGSLTTLRHDHLACIDDTACPGRKIAFLKKKKNFNEHALNRELVPLKTQQIPKEARTDKIEED